MGTPAGLDDDNKKTLTHVRDILLMANNELHSLNTAKKWNVPDLGSMPATIVMVINYCLTAKIHVMKQRL